MRSIHPEKQPVDTYRIVAHEAPLSDFRTLFSNVIYLAPYRKRIYPMKNIFILVSFFCTSGLLFAQKQISLDDCFVFYKFYPESGTQFRYLKDAIHYLRAEGDSLHIPDP